MADDDLRDVLGEEYADLSEGAEGGEEQPKSGEGSNRTFIIGVAILAGLLFCVAAAFVIVQLIVKPALQANQVGPQAALEMTATSQAIEVAMMDGTATAEALQTEPPTEEPTATSLPPTPSPTPVLGPTNTPTPKPTAAVQETPAKTTPAVVAQANTPTTSPRRTPTPTATPRNTPKPGVTPKPTVNASGGQQPPQTGLGEVLLVVAAGLLLGIIFLARRLRKT